jgi:hypothetical protein
MKKLVLFLVLVAISPNIVSSQDCLPEGITFYNQGQVDNFQANYPGCTAIEGDVIIDLESEINNLNGLSILNSIGGNFILYGDYYILNLSGLQNLISVGGDFILIFCWQLESLSALESLTYIGGDFEISSHPSLTSLTGLETLNYIGGDLRINNNSNLSNLIGLQSLDSIGGDLNVSAEDSLINLTGLEELTIIGGGLYLQSNDMLNDLTGLTILNTVGGVFHLENNIVLSDLTGINALNNIGGSINIVNNDDLSSLIGFENINLGSIQDLTIHDNNSLSDCDVQSICQYLASPNGTITIYNNAPGCNSQAEVEAACLTSVEEIMAKKEITIFPNPATSLITIITPSGLPIEEAIIYNHLGQKALEEKPVNNVVDVMGLSEGLYFAVVKSNGRLAGTCRFIVKGN